MGIPNVEIHTQLIIQGKLLQPVLLFRPDSLWCPV